MGNIHLSKSNAIDKGLLFDWPYIQMKILLNRSANASVVSTDSNALAFRTLSSVLDRMEHKLTLDLLHHPVLEKALRWSPDRNTSTNEFLNRIVEFTKCCQHALDPPLSADDKRLLVLGGECGPPSVSPTYDSVLFEGLSSSYLSTFLSEDQVRGNRESSSNILTQLFSQLQQALDSIVSSRQPVANGDKVLGEKLLLCVLK